MNLECPKRKLVSCPKCGYELFSSAKYRTICVKCGCSFIVNKRINNADNSINNADNSTNSANIQDNILAGNVFEAMDKANFDLLNNKNLPKDWISIILNSEQIEYAFAKACKKLKKAPFYLIRQAVIEWLSKEKFIGE